MMTNSWVKCSILWRTWRVLAVFFVIISRPRNLNFPRYNWLVGVNNWIDTDNDMFLHSAPWYDTMFWQIIQQECCLILYSFSLASSLHNSIARVLDLYIFPCWHWKASFFVWKYKVFFPWQLHCSFRESSSNSLDKVSFKMPLLLKKTSHFSATRFRCYSLLITLYQSTQSINFFSI